MVSQIKEEEPPFSSCSYSEGEPSNNHRRHGWKYDVFLSFRGEDTRKTFVHHLYSALHQRGIFTFRDDERLERGKSIALELLKAIELSRFAIVVFSKNYASSSWCLDELAKIMDCHNNNNNKYMAAQFTVIPIFYDVQPSDGTKNIEGILLHPQRERKLIDIPTEAFKEMHKLRLLELRNVWTPRVPEYLPSALRWLIWEEFPSKSLPPRFEADNLVGLQMYRSSIECPWRGEKVKFKDTIISTLQVAKN
ncbi:hypothetical protein LguiB_013065 [Lonicera macranthoides]